MPVFNERKPGTSVNIDSSNMRASSTNGTSARKFVAPESSVEQHVSAQAVINENYLVDAVSSMTDAMQQIVDIAAQARISLAEVTANIQTTNASFDRNDIRELPTEQLVPEQNEIFSKYFDTEANKPYNRAIPRLDSIAVDMDKNKGSIDCFFSKLTVSIPTVDVPIVKALRVFRSSTINPAIKDKPTLSMKGVETLSCKKMSGDRSPIEHRLRESGILNAVTALNPFDTTINKRISTSDTTKESSDSSQISTNSGMSTSAASSFLDESVHGEFDKSVSEDLKTAQNIRNMTPSFLRMNSSILVEPKKMGQSVNTVVDKQNSAQYREIAFLSLDKLKSTVIGDMTQYTIVDETISYGRGYSYYVLTVDSSMIESVRSRIVNVVVEVIRVPGSPSRVYTRCIDNIVTLNIRDDDKLTEKFEIYKREEQISRIKGQSSVVNQVSDVRGFSVSQGVSKRAKNMFLRVGESLNGSHGTGANFLDRDVVPGVKYLYRIYSVDIFGNKSERPHETSAFVIDKGGKTNDLSKPTITAEVDSFTSKMRLTFRCNDKRVKKLFLSRMDNTINQLTFTIPSQPNVIKLGNTTAVGGPKRKEDILFRDKSWNGVFDNTTNDIVFIDNTVSLDHSYQYKIYGIDSRGNATSDAISKNVAVTRRPMIGSPVQLDVQVLRGSNSSISSVRLKWQNGDIDVSSEDRVGDRTLFSASLVRTLYQVERMKVGEDIWQSFPMTEQNYFDDKIDDVDKTFRPSSPQENQEYIYRVKALQTGSFQSNYSKNVELLVSSPILPPDNFRIKTSDTKVYPFYAMLNWDTNQSSAVIDKWEIQRAEINNVAAANINPGNARDVARINFEDFRVVFRESSRFSSHDVDNIKKSGAENTALTSGQHYFQDLNISFGNSYFYRIRSVGINGNISSWVYRGVKVTDESFERNIMNSLSSKTIKHLSENNVPMTITKKEQDLNTFSVVPDFSKTSPTSTVTTTDVAIKSKTILVTPEKNVSGETQDSIRTKTLQR